MKYPFVQPIIYLPFLNIFGLISICVFLIMIYGVALVLILYIQPMHEYFKRKKLVTNISF